MTPSSPVAFGHDFRLVPAAAVLWLAGLTGLLLAWWMAVLVGAVAALSAAVVGWRVRTVGALWRDHGSTGHALVVLVVAGLWAAVPMAVGLYAAEHDPLRATAESGGQAVARVLLTARARPVRSVGYGGQPGGGSVLLRGEVEQVRVAGEAVPSVGRVLLVASSAGWRELLPGQRVTVNAALTPARPGELTVAVLQIRAPPADVTQAPWWQRAARAMRSELREVAGVLGPEEAGLLPGLVVGDTSALPLRVEQEFLDAGMSHLVAVSGSNLVIVCGAVLLVLRVLRVGPQASACAAGLVLVGFVILVGYEPSVLRAGVMGGVGLLALALGRQRSAMPALAVAVLVLVAADPGMAVSVGFALSVLVTAALVLFAPAWAAALHRRGAPAAVATAIAVPLAAFLVTAPVIAGVAGQLSLVTVAANVLAAPVVAPATLLGFLAAVTAPVAPGVAELLVHGAGPEAGWLVYVAREAAAVPGAVIEWPGGWWGGALAAAACAAVVVMARFRRGRAALSAVVLGAAVVAVPSAAFAPGWPPDGWVFVACDVGQGDGLVLATGEPGSAVVVDAGTELGEIDRCLDRLDVDRIPLLALSHLHADHVGGLTAVLSGRRIGAIAVGPGRAPHWAWRDVLAEARADGIPVVSPHPGQRLRWPGLDLHVLGPRYVATTASDDDGTMINNASLVFKAVTPAGSVLLTGDVELSAQADLLGSEADLRADVLKVPHHGSRYSLPEFVAAVRPRIAVISVGADNRHGHPSPLIVDHLRRSGTVVARTDLHGDTAVVATEHGPAVVGRGS